MTSNLKKTPQSVCPLCSTHTKIWKVKKIKEVSYSLDSCPSCSYCFVNPRPSLDFLMNYYSSFGHGDTPKNIPCLQTVLDAEKKDPNSTTDAKRMIQTIRSLIGHTKNHKLLDVGCGYGFFSKEALLTDFEVTALELAKNEREIAREMTGILPFDSSFENFDHPRQSMDVVLMSQILEHAMDVNLWIKKSREFLVDGGILAIALPNFNSIFRMILQENDPYICPPAHLNFFSPKSLAILLKKHGFKIETIQWISRIPKKTFEKRLPKIISPFFPAMHATSKVTLKLLDILHLGAMINIYGRKI